MSSGIMTRIGERVLTALTLIAAVVFLASLATTLWAGGAKPSEKRISVGTPLTLPGDNGLISKPTLVIALQAECAYCEDSMPFYRELIASNSANSFHLTAVVPHSETVGRELLGAAGVKIDDVRTASFTSLRISGTPTLIITDAKGVVTNVWTGKLSARSEREVFEKLGIKRADSRAELGRISEETHEIASVLAKDAPLIDVRDRAVYRQASLAGSLNIPLEELHTRLPREVPKDTDGVLYCDEPPRCAVMYESTDAQSLCDIASRVVKDLGFASLRVVTVELAALAEAGLPVSRGGK